jgi:hypothetical protein
LNDILIDREMMAIAADKNGNGAAAVRYCDCPELLINGQRVPCPPGHDCNYTLTRSALVLAAERRAGEKVRVGIRTVEGAARWTNEFGAEMDRLAAPLLNETGT